MPMQKNTLEWIIADIESGDNPYAMRFEPGIYARMQISARYNPMIERAKQTNICSRETAKIICATSWGRFQIMGFNLYDVGLNLGASVGEFMAEVAPRSQAAYFLEFCVGRGIYFTLQQLRENQASVLRFAKVYNGSLAYADKINARLPEII
jgi:hypothetical protein